MSLTLRPYQLAAVAKLREHPPGGKGALAVLCVGAGKTLTALTLCAEVLEAGGRVVWLAHRDELVSQPYNDMVRYWPKHGLAAGVVKATRDAVDARMVFASIQTLARPKRLAALLKWGAFDLVILDEAHHDTTPSYRAVLDGLRGPTTRLVGLTATPDREDGAPIGDFWEIVYTYDLLDAIPAGWLVEPFVYRYRMPELDTVLASSGGRLDHDDEVQGAQLLRSHVVDHTVRVCSEACTAERLPWRDGSAFFEPRALQGIVFTATVEQAQLTASALCQAGIRARSLSALSSPDERALVLRSYRRGEIRVLCNANLLTEGTDLPCTGFVVYARATRSRPLYVQILGRSVRLHDPDWQPAWGLCNRLDPRYHGKPRALVIDLTGCTEEHSIIAAPVLVDGACDHVGPGGEGYVPGTSWRKVEGKARCDRCENTRPCFASLLAGGDGQHAYPSKGRPVCRHCGREQCPGSPAQDDSGADLPSAGRHVWSGPDSDHKHRCIYCPAEYTDPLASVYSGPRRDAAATDTRFVSGDEGEDDAHDYGLVRLDLDVETWAVDLDAHGVLFLAGSRAGAGSWAVWWLAASADAPRALGAAYDTRRAWAVARDLIRQMARRRQDFRGRETWAGHAERASREEFRARATALALRLGVARAAA